MIGQKKNIDMIKQMISANTMSRFFILIGTKGSGRKELSHIIAKELNAYEVNLSISVDSVREAVACSYKCDHATVYIFSDADKMSVQAKNALLKITEEPPKQAYFILSVLHANNLPDTVISRGTCVYMQPYTSNDLSLFVESIDTNQINAEKKQLILSIAENPGQILQFLDMDVKQFILFCDSVLDNIGIVTGVNALKIGNKIKVKDDGDGYDSVLFLTCVCKRAKERLYNSSVSKGEAHFAANTVICCIKYLRELSLTGVRKDATIDMWVLEMRELWKEYME